jgi:hypothetical protein
VPVLQFDDQAQHAGRLTVHAQRRNGLADAAEGVAIGIEDRDAGQAGDEDAGGRGHSGAPIQGSGHRLKS